MRPNPPPSVHRGGQLAGCLLAALGLLPLAGCREPASQAAPPPPTVGVVAARRMTVPILSTATGTTRAIQEVAIRARVRGFLTEQHFEEGAFVEKGQLLFVIEEEPFEIALQSARSRLADAEAKLKAARESKRVQIAEATLAVGRAKLAYSQLDEMRGRRLAERGAQTREELDRQIADLHAAQAEVQAREADLLQARVDYQSGIDLAEAALEAARAEVAGAELDLGYCRMYAPIDGRIGEAKVKVGNLVGPTSPGGPDNTELASIQQLDPMGVDVRVSSRYLERTARLVAEGLGARLTRSGIGGDSVHPHEGQVYFYDNLIDPTTSTFLVKVRVPNPEGTLLPGEYVNLKSTIGELTDAVVVPEQAVMETQAGPVVYVVDDEGRVAIQEVEAAQTYEGVRVVAAGLEPGRQVIVEGLQLARPGIPVKVEPAHLPAPARGEPGDADPGSPDPAAAQAPGPDGEDDGDPAPPEAVPGGPRSAVGADAGAPTPAAPRPGYEPADAAPTT